jgi:hypothetical protein
LQKQTNNKTIFANNFQPEKDFWKEGGKTFASKEVAITLLSRYNNKNLMLAA